jgi:cytidylate kinase
VPVGDAVVLDEHVDPWLHRITRPLWGKNAGLSAFVPIDLFDADAEAGMANQIIQEAHGLGNCVIVGRGSQCVLHAKPDVFHVFVYAPWADRVRRIQARVAPGANINKLLHFMDAQRLE